MFTIIAKNPEPGVLYKLKVSVQFVHEYDKELIDKIISFVLTNHPYGCIVSPNQLWDQLTFQDMSHVVREVLFDTEEQVPYTIVDILDTHFGKALASFLSLVAHKMFENT